VGIERNEDWDSDMASDTDAQFATLAATAIRDVVRTSEQVFRSNATAAAQQIVDLALSGANERVRLDASKYIIERVMGKPGERTEDDSAPWEGVYAASVRQEPSAAERASGARIK
jgi:hypothetical protein